MSVAAFDLLCGLRLEDDRAWGAAATAVQRDDARALLDPASPVVRRWIGRSRGYSKSTDCGAMAVAALAAGLVPAGESAFLVAADKDQAAIVLNAARGFVTRTAGLGGLFDLGSWSITSKVSGARLVALASDASSSFGLRASWWTIDEVTSWADSPESRRFFEAISSSWPKQPSRVAIISTAGSLDHWSRRLYEHALADPLWSVSDTHGVAPWLDEAVIEGERRRLPESAFDRLWCNVWSSSGDESLVDAVDLDACFDGAEVREPRAGVAYCIGVDLGLRSDASVVAVCHREVVDDVVHVVLDRLDVFEPVRGREVDLAAVRDVVAAQSREYRGARVLIDRWNAGSVSQDLARRSVRVGEVAMTVPAISSRALAVRSLVREHRLHLVADDGLRDEFLSARLVEKSGGFRIDHPSGKHDDRVVAVSFAVEYLLSRRDTPSWQFVMPGGGTRRAPFGERVDLTALR